MQKNTLQNSFDFIYVPIRTGYAIPRARVIDITIEVILDDIWVRAVTKSSMRCCSASESASTFPRYESDASRMLGIGIFEYT